MSGHTKQTVAAIAAMLAAGAVMAADDAAKKDDSRQPVTSWTDPKSGTSYALSAEVMTQEEMSAQDLRKGKVQFRLTTTLYEFKKRQRYPRREEGTAHIVVRNDAGEDVLTKDVSLAKMCPS